MSICIFELARSLIGLNLFIFISILKFQRANISLFGEAKWLFFRFFLLSRWYNWMEINKNINFWLFSAFRSLLKKKMQKNAIIPYFWPTVQLYRKQNISSREAAINSIQIVSALELYFMQKQKIVENFQYFAIYRPPKIAFLENCKIFEL